MYHIIYWDREIFNTLRVVETQYPIGKYKADFAFLNDKKVVELDGHEYHKTKEQRTHDAKRDRYIIGEGWTVLRFTGTEIFNDVYKCYSEIIYGNKE